MEIKDLIGKTISNAELLEVKGYIDEPYLELTFTDGTSTIIEANYGGYGGISIDEYPRYIYLIDKSMVYKDEN